MAPSLSAGGASGPSWFGKPEPKGNMSLADPVTKAPTWPARRCLLRYTDTWWSFVRKEIHSFCNPNIYVIETRLYTSSGIKSKHHQRQYKMLVK